jgi:RNase H-fold protein (predicted Holliday junction resolvase)
MLADAQRVQFVFVDERFSTVEALSPMFETGTRKVHRESLRDSASAVVILQRVLDDPAAQCLSRLKREH